MNILEKFLLVKKMITQPILTGHLLDYPYFKENQKMFAIDLNKQQLFMNIQKEYHNLIYSKSRSSRRNIYVFHLWTIDDDDVDQDNDKLFLRNG